MLFKLPGLYNGNTLWELNSLESSNPEFSFVQLELLQRLKVYFLLDSKLLESFIKVLLLNLLDLGLERLKQLNLLFCRISPLITIGQKKRPNASFRILKVDNILNLLSAEEGMTFGLFKS